MSWYSYEEKLMREVVAVKRLALARNSVSIVPSQHCDSIWLSSLLCNIISKANF